MESVLKLIHSRATLPDYEPDSEEVCNDQDKFIPKKATPPMETSDVVAAATPSGDAQDSQDELSTPMDTSEKEVTIY